MLQNSMGNNGITREERDEGPEKGGERRSTGACNRAVFSHFSTIFCDPHRSLSLSPGVSIKTAVGNGRSRPEVRFER